MTTSPIHSQWKFWIDVGGTFTDCVAVCVTEADDGRERRLKVLSSGMVKGTLELGNHVLRSSHHADAPSSLDAPCFFDRHRNEPDDFWNGVRLRLLSHHGEPLAETDVVRFHRMHHATGEVGVFEFHDSFLPKWNDAVKASYTSGQGSSAPTNTLRYELDAGLPAPILAIHLCQSIPVQHRLKPCGVDLGTTRGTNALLTRNGARTALVTSIGFQDFLSIGDQTRPDLFSLTVKKPDPLFETAIEIRERVLSDGTVEQSVDEDEVREKLSPLRQSGIESLAICLMFGFRYPHHEQTVARIAKELGFKSIRCSSEVAPVIKIVPRGETTVLDAYLDPVIASYLSEIQSHLPPSSALRLMTSAGGLVSMNRFSGKDSVLSGPAGGVVGAARVGQQMGLDRVIGFDMGGTSTDVSRFDGHFDRTFETRKAGVRIVTPMLEVETVAAGGGSICWFDGTKLRVGPQSAGANPGPACYGRGGPLTVTDVNLYLGRFQPEQFPFALDLQSVLRRLDELVDATNQAPFRLSRNELAAGLLNIANHHMAAAIKSVSISKGVDPRTYSLVSFGGAGSQHGCGVADLLGIQTIIDHPSASVLSAVGIGLSDQASHAVQAVAFVIPSENRSDIEDIENHLNDTVFRRLSVQAGQTLLADGNRAEEIELTRSLDLRYQGTDVSLNIELPKQSVSRRFLEHDSEAWIPLHENLTDAISKFESLHQRQFGYLQNRPVEIVSARLDARIPGRRLKPIDRPPSFETKEPERFQTLTNNDRSHDAGVFDRSELKAGDRVVGPAVIADSLSTTVVDSGWTAHIYPENIIRLEKMGTDAEEVLHTPHELETCDPVLLEIFNHHFSTIAEQMGIALQKTSVSVNVKERLDFSCAIFSKVGDLVVNAPHIPVHLGAMSETVRATIALNPNVAAGDVFATNDPYAGGSHLPDITVVSPVFSPDGSALWFWVASRSHHAELGGATPGSMPPSAKRLGDEGVLIQNFQLIAGSRSPNAGTGLHPNVEERFDQLRAMLTAPPYPSRSPDENIADLRAQVAANRTGENQLYELVKKYTHQRVSRYMAFIQDAAERAARAAIGSIADGEYRFEDSMDDGATIRVLLTKRDDHLTIDFSGTDPVQPDNLNANRAITSAAIMYVLRLLIGEAIPLNEGIMKAVTLKLPECFLHPSPADNPLDSPAIVGGNVETSQRIVDGLLGALGLAAASQGTMNNWLMGNSSFGYYETIGGGSGATADGDGADAVHTHMTNTRLTDPEILETRYPVILREMSIRRDTGGTGLHCGGDGMVREIEFLEPMTVSLLTSRRSARCRPFGLAGGEPGARGFNQLFRHNGKVHTLPGRYEMEVQPGDRLRIKTPGGGGYGKAE